MILASRHLSAIFSGARETVVMGHRIWSHDAHVVMKDISHLNLIAMGLLQTCRYITEQMQTEVTIDVNKFMESFSIKTDGGIVHPSFWTRNEDNQIVVSPSQPINRQSDPNMALPKPFNMNDYCRCQQAEAIRWINLQEKRASIIARLQPITPEDYKARRDAVYAESGPIRRKDKKPAGEPCF